MSTASADLQLRRARLVFLRDLARIGVPREERDNTDWSDQRAARYAPLPYFPTDDDPLDRRDIQYALTASGVRNASFAPTPVERRRQVQPRALETQGRRRRQRRSALVESSEPARGMEGPSRSMSCCCNGQKDSRAKRAKGGHLHGAGMPNKTQFPPSWTAADIEEAYASTRLDPDWRRVRNSGDVMLLREVDGVRVSLAYHSNPDGTERVIHGYPESGPGVTRTDSAGTPTTTIDTHSPVNVHYTWALADRSEPTR